MKILFKQKLNILKSNFKIDNHKNYYHTKNMESAMDNANVLVAPSRVRKVMLNYLNGEIMKMIENKKEEISTHREFHDLQKKMKANKKVLESTPAPTKEVAAALTAENEKAAKRCAELESDLAPLLAEKKDLGRVKIKFSSTLSSLLSRFFEFTIEEILRNSFTNVLEANRKMVGKSHLLKNSNTLKTFTAFCNLPAWQELVSNKMANVAKAAESKEKDSEETVVVADTESAASGNSPTGSVISPGKEEERTLGEDDATMHHPEEDEDRYFFTYISKVYKNIIFRNVQKEGEDAAERYVDKKFEGIKVKTATKEFLSKLLFQMIRRIANSIIVMKNNNHLHSFSVSEDLLRCILSSYVVQVENVTHKLYKERDRNAMNALRRYKKRMEERKEGEAAPTEPAYLKEEDIPLVQYVDYEFIESPWTVVEKYMSAAPSKSVISLSELPQDFVLVVPPMKKEAALPTAVETVKAAPVVNNKNEVVVPQVKAQKASKKSEPAVATKKSDKPKKTKVVKTKTKTETEEDNTAEEDNNSAPSAVAVVEKAEVKTAAKKTTVVAAAKPKKTTAATKVVAAKK